MTFFFFVSFQFSRFKFYIELTHYTNYLQPFNFSKVKTEPRIRTKEGGFCLPITNSGVGDHGPFVHGTNWCTTSIVEPALSIPKRAPTVPFSFTLSSRLPSAVVYPLVFVWCFSFPCRQLQTHSFL